MVPFLAGDESQLLTPLTPPPRPLYGVLTPGEAGTQDLPHFPNHPTKL